MRQDVRSRRKIDPKCLGRLLVRIEVDPESGCWFIAGRNPRQRVHVNVDGDSIFAYRFIYEALVGPVLPGFVIDHLCQKPGCLNPHHLEPVTLAENSRRAVTGIHRKPKTHCIRGHALSGQNLLIQRDTAGHIHRQCRICRTASAKAWYERKKKTPKPGPRVLARGMVQERPADGLEEVGLES